jgi:hypothetical protein
MSTEAVAARLRSDRLRAQRLTPDVAAATPVDAVRHLIGIQAQLPSAATLAIRARTAGSRAAQVEHDAAPGGPLVRTWLMRGTLHLAAADDIGWLLAVLAPTVLRASRRRHTELNLDPATVARSADVLVQLLEDGLATRAELFAGLARHGIDPAGQRGIHLIRHAALLGLLHCGPDRGREQTWLLSRPGPAPVDRDQALSELANRYQQGYAPADPHDLAAWSGLTVADAWQAWRLAGALPSEAGHRGSTRSTVRLLPHFDPYLLGYASRDHVVLVEHMRRVWTGGGYVLPTMIVGGRAVGIWRSAARRGRLAVTVTPFDARPLDARVSAAIGAEVADIGRFLRRDAAWSYDPAVKHRRDRQPHPHSRPLTGAQLARDRPRG